MAHTLEPPQGVVTHTAWDTPRSSDSCDKSDQQHSTWCERLRSLWARAQPTQTQRTWSSWLLSFLQGAQKPDGYLHGLPLFWAVIALNAANTVAFADQLALVAVLPQVSAHFGADVAVEWATTFQLIGSCVGQAVFG